jgi:hypothetical protein
VRINGARRLFALLLVAAGCSGSGGGAPPTGSGGAGGGAAGSGGSGGDVGTAGSAGGGSEAGMGGSGGVEPTAGSGGNAGVDASGSAGSGGGTAGAVGTDAGGGGPGTDGGAPQNFTCSLVLGAGQTIQWYNGGGFESAVGTAKWEIKAADNTFTEAWASPASSFWGLATQSPCAANATMPDRVLLIVYSKTITAEADWEMQITKVMANIKTKFPSAKQIDLLTMARGPGNTMCGTAVATQISPAQDQAMKAVADGSAGMIKVGPQYFVPTCAAFATTNNTNLTSAGATAVAQMLAAVYK